VASTGSGLKEVPGCCENFNGPLGSITCREFFSAPLLDEGFCCMQDLINRPIDK
jgi:hypothetical protein